MKVVFHHGVKCDPDRRDVVGSDQHGISLARDVVRRHLPGIETTPSILESCMYTVSIYTKPVYK